MSNVSPLAKQMPHRLDAIRRRAPWGLLLHTTGSRLTERAAKARQTAIKRALRYYRTSQDGANGYPWGGPTYVMDVDGTLYQIAEDDIMTMHAGGPFRTLFLSGEWERHCPAGTVARWRTQWPDYESPAHLFPSRTPNIDYVGVEMIPCTNGFGEPWHSGLLFSRAQHDAAVALGRDLAARHGWPEDWARGPRLVGHEDVQFMPQEPYGRINTGGGWDPGWLRGRPYFDFGYVREALR